MGRTVCLVGCCGPKVRVPTFAKQLYTSNIFKKQKQLATLAANKWFILSAKYGLVDPDEIIAPYDLELGSQTSEYVTKWAEDIYVKLRPELKQGDKIVFMCGEDYHSLLASRLQVEGFEIKIFMQGQGIGYRNQILKEIMG